MVWQSNVSPFCFSRLSEMTVYFLFVSISQWESKVAMQCRSVGSSCVLQAHSTLCISFVINHFYMIERNQLQNRWNNAHCLLSLLFSSLFQCWNTKSTGECCFCVWMCHLNNTAQIAWPSKSIQQCIINRSCYRMNLTYNIIDQQTVTTRLQRAIFRLQMNLNLCLQTRKFFFLHNFFQM